MEWTNVRKTLQEYGEEVARRYKEKMTEGDSVASSNLINSIRVLVEGDESKIEVCLELAHYWKYIEFGRKPKSKMPPISAIQEWIKVKPIIPTERNGHLPTEKQLAFLIARSIGEKGIKEKPYLSETLEELNDRYYERLTEAVALDVQGEFDTLLSMYEHTGIVKSK